MLTGDLVRARVQKKELRPSLVDPENDKVRERAQAVFSVYQAGLETGANRGELKAGIDEVLGDGIDHKLVRGLAKVLSDASKFTTEPPVPAPELRARLFEMASSAPSRAFARQVYAQVAEEIGLAPEEVQRLLYADRKQEQVILKLGARDIDWLLNRYNVALVQSLLLRCQEMEVRLADPSPERVRQLFRFVKFHGLMHRLEKAEGGISVILDGPASLLRLSTRYGMALANWFPALLLQECPWELEGTVHWTRRNLRKHLVLDSTLGLVSHYRDTGAYITQTETWFQERFEALETDWSLTREGVALDIGGNQVVVPDFTFSRDGKVAHLEIVGFWRRSWLSSRMKLLKKGGPKNLVMAVSTKLAGTKEALSKFPGRVVYFKEVVPPKDVLACLERVAC
ncbi:MAG: DUF790 family protein [Myxococcota bacterium]|nr:DUF790 family protein [Myxococcota bacterium]